MDVMPYTLIPRSKRARHSGRDTMKILLTLLIACSTLSIAHAQIAGGAGSFGNNRPGAALAQELAKRASRNLVPPDANSFFVDASVLINVKADEYIAVFGISQEGLDIKAARAKVDAMAEQFTKSLASVGIKKDDVYVDFISQNRVYGYKIEGDTAREEVQGFELKKNVSIHYKDPDLINKLTDIASDAGIFDLIKVDYVVTDPRAIQKKLMMEAAKIVKDKLASRSMLLDTPKATNVQVYAEDYSSYYPTNSYSNYVAQESENLNGYRQNLLTIRARKTQTVYFDPLGQEAFDTVINPIVIEPVVQFTIYLKVLYSNPPAKAAG